jgi:O-antigen/teichoic acid export membrane protein
MPNEPATTTSSAETLPTQQIVRGGFWVAFGSYFYIGFGFLANLALTRILAPEHYGAFTYANSFYMLLNLRARIPVGYGFIQKKEITPELIGTNLALSLAFSVIGLLLVGLAVPVIYALRGSWQVAWIALALASAGIIEAFSNTHSALLNRQFHFGWPTMANSVAFPLSYIPGFALALNHGGAWSLLAQNVTYVLLYGLLLWLIARRTVPQWWAMPWRFDKTLAVYLFRFGLTVSLGALAAMLVGSLDYFLIGTFVDLDTLGFYERAFRLANWPTVLVTTIIAKMTLYTYAHVQNDPPRLKKAVTMSFWLITSLGLPMALAMFASAPDLIQWLYGENWLPSAVFLRFLVLYGVIQPLLGDAGTLFIAIGKPRWNVVMAISEAATLLVVGALLTIPLGAVGTSIAVGLAFVVGLSVAAGFIRQAVRLDFWQSWGIPAAAALLTLAAYLLGESVFDLSAWPVALRAISKGAFATAVYLGLILVFQPRETLERVQFIWQRIRP